MGVGAVLLDLSKPFDTANHAKLLNKLPKYGIVGKELEWFMDYLFCGTQMICYKNPASNKHLSGVPQGSVLMPLLF